MPQSRPAGRLLSLLSVSLPLAALPPAVSAAPPSSGCPGAVVSLIDGLYRWHITSTERDRVRALASQRARFTPALFSELSQAFALTPADGAFVDFDPFSGTQVDTLGHRLEGCRLAGGGRLEARVGVVVGLSSRRPSAETVPLAFVLQPDRSGWRIADIRYRQGDGFSLRAFLADLRARTGRGGGKQGP